MSRVNQDSFKAAGLNPGGPDLLPPGPDTNRYFVDCRPPPRYDEAFSQSSLETKMAFPRISLKIAISVLLLLTAFGVLVGLSFRGSMVYYLTVSEFLTKPPSDLDGHFRVNGKVVAGTIVKESGILGAHFQMTDGKSILPVVFRKELPDTFVDAAEVVVEGRMKGGVFEAQTLFAKCPSKYESAQKASTGG
jgi:cytochrome c-type biogenesis protein CcmE